jgi:sec-independent protein translocase protein TatC
MLSSRFTQRRSAEDDSRMSIGDHLEELRRRILWGLLGLVVATVVCFYHGGTIIEFLTTPYTVAMEELGFDPRLVQLNPIEAFMEYFKISLKFGLVLGAPWLLYQLWRFVAAGLYPSEQRFVRMFAPWSILLFVTGGLFMVLIVLFGLMKFLISISAWFPLPSSQNAFYEWLHGRPVAVSQPADALPPLRLPQLDADPAEPAEGQVWINRTHNRLTAHYGGQTYYAPMQRAAERQFVQPFFSISEYLGFVVNLALAFGLGFQIPIVVVFLISMGIVEAAVLASLRRYVVVGVVVLAAIVTPTPDVGTMLLLAVPMLILFEVGLLIGRGFESRRAAEGPPGGPEQASAA